MAQKPTSTPADSAPLTGEEIYDTLMKDIDVDLLTANVNGLEEKYKGETKAQRAARLERYKKSYAAYDKAYALWTERLHQLVTDARRTALKSAEAQSKSEEEKVLSSLEAQLAN